ncbi:MAG: hypothetical protein DRJ05_03305 [Bacteroidetes bacterium]|nr:MAG: hypothetical protein DRJ05_03305 [Bacteroidota bacterium]
MVFSFLKLAPAYREYKDSFVKFIIFPLLKKLQIEFGRVEIGFGEFELVFGFLLAKKYYFRYLKLHSI